MSNLISGMIAISLSSIFLIYYAVKLHSVGLWFIIGANLVCVLSDFVQSIREDKINNGK